MSSPRQAPAQPAYQAVPSPAAQPAAAPRKSRNCCCLALVLALAVIIALGVAGSVAGGRFLSTLNPPVTGSGCTKPCANQSGWIVEVTKFVYGAKGEDATAEPDNVFVTMDVTFTNKSGREQHANPATFVLQDGKGVKRSLEFMGPCPAWSPVNVTPGGSFGPKCLTFQAAAGKPAGIALVWTPNFLGSDYSIHLS